MEVSFAKGLVSYSSFLKKIIDNLSTYDGLFLLFHNDCDVFTESTGIVVTHSFSIPKCL